ncbi:MAG: hypothetical protein V3W37_10405 [Candidatus Binatia bacterium]
MSEVGECGGDVAGAKEVFESSFLMLGGLEIAEGCENSAYLFIQKESAAEKEFVVVGEGHEGGL